MANHLRVRMVDVNANDPGAHHSPQDPVHRELYYGAIEKWVVKYLGS